ncbi:hypothetical protein ACFT4A_15245 [Streptomyces sp. NPDC057099]
MPQSAAAELFAMAQRPQPGIEGKAVGGGAHADQVRSPGAVS